MGRWIFSTVVFLGWVSLTAESLYAQVRADIKPQGVVSNSRSNKTSELKAKYRLIDNYLRNWPKFVSIPKTVHVRVVSQDKAKSRYIYHSPSYEFICDVPLSTTIIGEFGLMFETTREYCRQLPISSLKAHVPKGQKRHRILLFENIGNYVKNGGHPRAAGVYVPSKDVILVPLVSVGVKKVSGGYNYDYTASNSVLIHEIVHQLTDAEYFSPGAVGWFSEGLAEYCARTPYRRGDFSVRAVNQSIKNYVTGTTTRSGLGSKIKAPDLEAFMLQSYGSFTSNAAYNYRLGTLLTYYFFHMERDRKNITAFLKALKRGERSGKALKSLLNSRSFDQLERDIENAWKASGIEIDFQ